MSARQMYPAGAFSDSVPTRRSYANVTGLILRENLSPIYPYDTKIEVMAFWDKWFKKEKTTPEPTQANQHERELIRQ